MRVVIVKDNVVENIAEGGPNDGAPEKGTTAHHYEGFVSIGWLWNNGTPTDPKPAAVVVPPTYAQSRSWAYPPLTDYVDALVHRESGNPQPYADYIAACLAVKAKYPKPEVT